MRSLLLILTIGLGAVIAACGEDTDEGAGPGRLRLATTTSTADSGLLEWLLEPFEADTGIEVQVVAVGTGQALALGRSGDADIVLVHARTLEDAFVDEGHGVDRRDVMWNDFVILGPSNDPAGVRGADDPADALTTIGAMNALFISRGDRSGTHVREQALWERAGIDPETSEITYWKAGQGMGAVLTMADEKRAYTLADRGTYLAFKDKVELDVLVEGHASLRNPYGVILVNPALHPHVAHGRAKAFADYLTSTEGQARIGSFRRNGDVLFHPVVGE